MHCHIKCSFVTVLQVEQHIPPDKDHQIFSLSNQTWRRGPELPFGVNWGQVITITITSLVISLYNVRFCHQAVVVDEMLHHVGGIRSKQFTKKILLLH